MSASCKSAKYSQSHIANYFLYMAELERIPMTLLKLMQHMYIGYGIYLNMTKANLFDENIEAWRHGIVIPSIYHEFKQFGLYDKIDSSSRSIFLDSDAIHPKPQKLIVEKNDVENDIAINYALVGAWLLLMQKSDNQLKQISCKDGSVWHKYYIPSQKIILNDTNEKREHISKEMDCIIHSISSMLD